MIVKARVLWCQLWKNLNLGTIDEKSNYSSIKSFLI